MLEIIDFMTFFWLTICFIYAIVNLSKGTNDLIIFPIIILYIFFGIPQILDMILGKPNYDIELGFRIATSDKLTGYIYDIYISLIPIIWWMTGRYKSNVKLNQKNNLLFIEYSGFRLVLLILIISPALILFFAPYPKVYLHYGAVLSNIFLEQETKEFHKIVSSITVLSVVSAGIKILIKYRTKLRDIIYVSPFFFISIWMNGKRAIVVLVVLIIIYILWQKKILKGMSLIASSAVLILLLLFYSNSYQNNFRYEVNNITSYEQKYKNFRIDFARDDRIKMTIFSEINPEQFKILDYRGESFFYNITAFIPRSIWENKPWPYSVYFTSAMLGIPTTNYLGWGMTTSLLEESIANFGWFGMIIGPLIISKLCRIGSASAHPLTRSLTVLVSSLLIVLQLSAFYPLFLLLVVFMIIEKIQIKKPELVGD